MVFIIKTISIGKCHKRWIKKRKKIGVLKSVAKENFCPGSELIGTYDLENCIDQGIYQKDDTLYLKINRGCSCLLIYHKNDIV